MDDLTDKELAELMAKLNPVLIEVEGPPWPCALGDHEHCPAINSHPAVFDGDSCPCPCHIRELETLAK